MSTEMSVEMSTEIDKTFKLFSESLKKNKTKSVTNIEARRMEIVRNFKDPDVKLQCDQLNRRKIQGHNANVWNRSSANTKKETSSGDRKAIAEFLKNPGASQDGPAVEKHMDHVKLNLGQNMRYASVEHKGWFLPSFFFKEDW